MAVDAHLHELTEKHRALEQQIETELARPLADTLKIAELKKEKLRIKDEIAELEGRKGQSQVA
ncbi:MAG: DUF465 domain-containing protein [Methyloligellaceae bacterium]|nr:MAG: DUF465 domain-containing protein [Alphaproteobacteria bacterium]